tara:strand:+ start:103 stop:288 length:186 start_codon:yes stop_codon:yes gene_type:complete
MTNTVETIVMSLGTESAESLGFKTEEQIEIALIPLMADIICDKTVSVEKRSRGMKAKYAKT